MKTLYPSIEPFNHFYLETDRIHRVYVEQSGNVQGISVIFLHGGPCSGTKPDHRCFFNPEKYHIILFDQRGCGRSLPFGEIENNTLPNLIADMEAIRQKLSIEKWLIFGGSWGATLGLYYAQHYTNNVLGLILRGAFLARQQDMSWFLGKSGAALIYPERYQHILQSVSLTDFSDALLTRLYDGLLSVDEILVRRITKAWMNWGAQVALGNAYQPELTHEPITEKDVLQARMELHYAKNHYFLAENELLNHCANLQPIPTVIIHGRHDLVCPIEAGWQLHRVMSWANYHVLPNSGHIAKGEEMINALVCATDNFKIDAI